MNPTNLPPGSGENRARYFLSITWSEFAVSAALIAMRLWCRVRITRNIWWDDWAILIPFVFILAASSLSTVYAINGGTRHVFDLVPAEISKVTELTYILLVFSIMAIVTGKISVALLIYRLQSPSKWRTWLLVFLSTSSLVVGVLAIATFFGQCTPAKALWIPAAGHCWDAKKEIDSEVAIASYFAFVDFALALLPVTFLWNLQMKWTRKVVLCMLLGLGVFAAISAAIKTSYLPTLTAKADVTWITVDLLVWNATETNVIIYAAFLPAVYPLSMLFVGKVWSYASGKQSLFGQRSSRGTSSTGNQQHFKLGSIGSKPYGSGPRKEGFGMDNETHELCAGRIKRSVDVDIIYGQMDEEHGHVGNSVWGFGGEPVSGTHAV